MSIAAAAEHPVRWTLRNHPIEDRLERLRRLSEFMSCGACLSAAQNLLVGRMTIAYANLNNLLAKRRRRRGERRTLRGYAARRPSAAPSPTPAR